METFLALVFLGCVFYSGKVILQYAAHSSQVSPRIDALEHEIERYAEELELEQVRCTVVSDRVASLRQILNDLRGRVRDLQSRVESERTREKRLQVAVYRERIRQSRRVLVP